MLSPLPISSSESFAYRLVPFESQENAHWDALVAASPMGTFLHTRRFLSYHEERFRDVSVLIENRDGKLLGIFPAAVDPHDVSVVVSHPGLTYGGVVHAGKLTGQSMLDCLDALKHHYGLLGFKRLQYKAVPYIYHRSPCSDDLYALFRLNARRYRCDLSTAIDLSARQPLNERRRRMLKKAAKAGLHISDSAEHAPAIWALLSENLQRKHGVLPVHSLEEVLRLHALFPEEIRFVSAWHQQELVSAVVLFFTSGVVHSQYIASSASGNALGGLDLVFDWCLDWSANAKKTRYFSFGISTNEAGQRLNEGLYQFKSEFGGAGVLHEFYEMDLTC